MLIFTALAILILVIVTQMVYITRLERGGFGAMSRAAGTVRLAVLSALRVPCAVVTLDIRGMHELNAVIGYMVSNSVVARVIKTHDMRCQFGGDEIVIFIPFAKPGTAQAIANRIVNRCKQVTEAMSTEKRAELYARTNGKIDGIHVAIISVGITSNALSTTHKALNELEIMKENGAAITGNRATTGNPGTLQKHYERL